MRAWQIHRYGAPHEALRLVDIDEPTPGPGELRVRVQAAAIGMPDAFMCRDVYAFRPPLPFVAGQEVCGVVDAVGDGVDLPIGSRVMATTSFVDGRGGFAEVTITRAASTFRVPDAMSDVEAAAFRIGFSTAWIGLVRRGAITAGETLLVLGGAGGSGATAIQLGKALGARVIAVAAGDEKTAFCRRMGADAVIDRQSGSVPDAVSAATEGRGVDLVYDPVGGELARATMRCLVRDGRLLVVGFASGEWIVPNVPEVVRRNIAIVGVYAGGYTREENDADHEALLAFAADGRLHNFATAVDFDELPSAIERVDSGAVIGKLVVRVAST